MEVDVMKNIKKLSITILLSAIVLMFSTAITAFADFSPIDCRDGRFTNSELKQLEDLRASVSEKTGWNICIVISDGYGDTIPRIYCDDYYDANYPVGSDGLMFLYDMDERYISTSGECIKYFNDLRIENLLDDIDDYYYDSKDYKAVECFLKTTEEYYDKGIVSDNYVFEGEYSGEKYQAEIRENAILSGFAGLIVGIIISAIVLCIIGKQYKFHRVPLNNNYLDKNSIDFNQIMDAYVTTRTTRTTTYSSGGGGGGGGHGGSSCHRSSSGGHHGGGGHSGRR